MYPEQPSQPDQPVPPTPHPSASSVYPTPVEHQAWQPPQPNTPPAPGQFGPPAEPTQPYSQPVGQPPQAYGQPSGQPIGQPTPNNAGLLVLQWLTYAFWGWTLVALSYLTGVVVTHFVTKASIGDMSAYIIAAVLVLLPISFICDSFYSKKEPAHKAGPAMAIMVIHAVIFALFGIGALIAAVFSIVTKFTSSGESQTSTIALITSLIIFVYYVVTFARTINPPQFSFVQKYYRYFMIGTVAVIALLGIFGPIAHERATKTDRLIESNLISVSNSVQDYAREKKSLPDNLGVLSLSGDAQKLVDDKLVTYKAEGEDTSTSNTNNSSSGYNTYQYNSKSFRYQLCVTYKDKDEGISYGSSNPDQSGYTNYLSTYGHAAGEVCYKLKTYSY